MLHPNTLKLMKDWELDNLMLLIHATSKDCMTQDLIDKIDSFKQSIVEELKCREGRKE